MRRSDDSHAKRARHRNGDDVLLERLAKTNAGVESLRDDVCQPGIDEGFDDDIGIVLCEPGQDGRYHHASGCPGCGYAHAPRGPLEQTPQILHGPRDFPDRRAETYEQALAGFRRRDASRTAGQQLNAYSFLEAANRVAERRRRDAKSRRGPREAAFLRDDGERRQAAPVFPVH